MPFKLNISEKGRAWKIDADTESLVGKSLGDKISGKEISKDLDGYELEITGGSDIAGFPLSKEIAGIGLKKVLLKKGWGMNDSRKGVRIKKTVRGKIISESITQINIKVIKAGSKPLSEIFPDQNKPKVKVKAQSEQPIQSAPEAKA